MRRPALLLVAATLLTACGNRSKDDKTSSDPRAVIVDEKGITVGGARVGDAPGDTIRKVDPLFAKLKENREAWKEAHPDGKFDGVLVLSLGPQITCRAAMSAYMTAAFAGYPYITIKQGDRTLTITASVPKPPDPSRDLVTPPAQRAHLMFHTNGEVELRPKRCAGAFDVVAAPSLPATVKEMCGEAKECPAAMRVQCDEGLPMAKVLPVLQEVSKLSANVELASQAGECKPDEGPMYDPEDMSFLGMDPLKKPERPPPKALPPGKKPPKLREGAVMVSGGLSEDEVRAALKPQLEPIRVCYEAALAGNPNLQGRVVARLAIGKKGGVMSIVNGGSDLPDASVLSCTLLAISKATFPAKGSISTITYPVMMSPGS